MAFHIWSDNETDRDLLGFRVHADLIRSVVLDSHILPIVLGLFGDWGSGKSSIMQMLRNDLNSDAYPTTACIYFNGWMFEGYEDAKSALLSSVLVQLGEHKRLGPEVRDKVVGLLKRVKWMEMAKLGVKHVGVPLAAALLTGGTAGVATAIGAIGAGAVAKVTAATSGSSQSEGRTESHEDKKQWSDLIEEAPGSPDVLEVRKFREEFESMLADTKLESLVILIDDLDRCLPERIIETLEAIKLFVAVPKTAFVVGADPRIVTHAIATRYAVRELPAGSAKPTDEQYDLVKDYLEKLIQIPYHLPRLSPSEVESYVNLLACDHNLAEPDLAKVLSHWQSSRKTNVYAAYRHAAVCEALGSAEAVPKALLEQLTWSNAIADVVTDGLKGNPRQVKRMLNAMALRKQLASVADISVRDDVLAKLMVLEYARPVLFQQLNEWQATENGFPTKLATLEQASIDNAKPGVSVDEDVKEWLKPTAQKWLRMQPGLFEIDLRDYFWLARDRTSSTLSGVMMIPPIIRRLFDSLISENKGERKAAVKQVPTIGETERDQLVFMLRKHIERHPEEVEAIDALIDCGEAGVPGAFTAVLSALKNCPTADLEPGVAFRVKQLGDRTGEHQEDAKALLQQWANDSKSKIGRAAAKAMRG